jgi:hypothetical protein
VWEEVSCCAVCCIGTSMLCGTIRCDAAPLSHAMLHCTALCYTTLYCTALHHATLLYSALHCTAPCYTTLLIAILHYTVNDHHIVICPSSFLPLHTSPLSLPLYCDMPCCTIVDLNTDDVFIPPLLFLSPPFLSPFLLLYSTIVLYPVSRIVGDHHAPRSHQSHLPVGHHTQY